MLSNKLWEYFPGIAIQGKYPALFEVYCLRSCSICEFNLVNQVKYYCEGGQRTVRSQLLHGKHKIHSTVTYTVKIYIFMIYLDETTPHR